MSLSDQATIVQSSETLCYYVNTTNQIQLIRVVKDRCLDARTCGLSLCLAPDGDAGSHRCLNLEKIVFPQQRILFEAMSEAQLEIYNSLSEDLRIAKIIPCRNLEVN